jgi:hypothetical protein
MLVVADFLPEELKYVPCIHTPTGKFNIKQEVECFFLWIAIVDLYKM